MSDCTTCAEYDGDKGYCPKYCEVIRRTVEELISREAAIDAFAKELCGNAREYAVGFNGAKKILENVPSAPRWIPVTERLPDKNGRYLVTCKQRGAWKVDWDIWYMTPRPGWLWEKGITAWMPLPEPWRGEEDE